MNKTLHLIKKDLRLCALWLLLWAFVCFTHFGLRMYQISFGDTAATSGFWSHLETTDRWDWQALRWLPLLIIPFFMHADPLVKRYAFWKSLPVNRWRLVFAKMVIVIVFFFLLPLVLEIIYLRAAGRRGDPRVLPHTRHVVGAARRGTTLHFVRQDAARSTVIRNPTGNRDRRRASKPSCRIPNGRGSEFRQG